MPKNERLELLFLLIIISECTNTWINPVKRLQILDDDFTTQIKLWEAIKNKEMPDLLSMYTDLSTIELDLIPLVEETRNKTYNIEDKLAELRQITIKRRLFLAGKDISKIQDIQIAKEELIKIEGITDQRIETMDELIADYLTPKPSTQIKTGFDKLNESIFFQKWDLVTIGARPSIGKSWIMLQMAIDMAIKWHKVLFFNIEMDKKKLMDRILSYLLKISNTLFKYNKVSDYDIKRGIDYLNGFKDNLIIINKKRITSNDIEVITNLNKPDVVVLDYLWLLCDKEKKWQLRTYLVGEWTRKFKILAGECNLLFIQASQLNRWSIWNNRKPRIEDLRESWSIEQDSDVVLLLHRENRGDPKTELLIGKNRNWWVWIVKMKMTMETTSFTEV